jgi:hypothetical protein
LPAYDRRTRASRPSLGIIALVGAKSVSRIEWAIILIIVGLIAGGVGGILVLLGGILSLILKYA